MNNLDEPVLIGLYKELARLRNGGLLRRNAHPSPSPTTWAEDRVAVTGIFAVGRTAQYSLCGGLGQELWLDEWGYPPLGVYFADTPSAGHDMLALDYASVVRPENLQLSTWTRRSATSLHALLQRSTHSWPALS